jgi:hypothetical protein
VDKAKLKPIEREEGISQMKQKGFEGKKEVKDELPQREEE